MPADFAMASRGVARVRKGETSHFEKLGIQVENLTPQVAEQLGVKAEHGVASPMCDPAARLRSPA